MAQAGIERDIHEKGSWPGILRVRKKSRGQDGRHGAACDRPMQRPSSNEVKEKGFADHGLKEKRKIGREKMCPSLLRPHQPTSN